MTARLYSYVFDASKYPFSSVCIIIVCTHKYVYVYIYAKPILCLFLLNFNIIILIVSFLVDSYFSRQCVCVCVFVCKKKTCTWSAVVWNMSSSVAIFVHENVCVTTVLHCYTHADMQYIFLLRGNCLNSSMKAVEYFYVEILNNFFLFTQKMCVTCYRFIWHHLTFYVNMCDVYLRSF